MPRLQIPFEDLEFSVLIGKGTFGEVHKGMWKEQTVALKKLKLPPDVDVTTLGLGKLCQHNFEHNRP